MVNKNTFKKQFPDVEEHTLSTTQVLSRDSLEKVLLTFLDAMETGLLHYSYDGHTITVYTSALFKKKLDNMPKGTILTDPNTGKQCTVVSSPYIMCCEMSFSVDFKGHPEAYSCSYFM